MPPPPNQRLLDPDASIVLVGSRGAGKRTLGFIGALHLRRRLITEDYYFEQVTGYTRGQYLNRFGKDDFARRSAEVFKRMLDANRSKCVIECGMGSLTDEAQNCLREYAKTNYVIYILREKEHVVRMLDKVDAEQVLLADQSHRYCSNMEFFNLYDTYSGKTSSGTSEAGSHWENHSAVSSRLLYAKEDFTRYIDLLLGHAWRRTWLESPFSMGAVPPQFRAYSYALRLRLSYLLNMNLEWEDFEARGDCVELIIDTWPNDIFNVIAKQVALIRRKLGVPVIYHVEEDPRDESKRESEVKDKMDSDLLELGLRLNVDFISIDLNRNPALIDQILSHRGRSKVLGNYWINGIGCPLWSDEVHVQNYLRAKALGCDVVRMVRFCSGDSAFEAPTEFREKIAKTIPEPKPPLVAYDFSVLGARMPFQSRVLNPVKHPDQPTGRDHLATVCTYNHSFEQLFGQNLLDALQFFSLGSNVSYSITPAIHHAAYEFSGMPHTCQPVECTNLEDLNRICYADNFGGAVLAAPFKVAILPQLKLKSHHATAVGAVNVLIPLRGKSSFILDHTTARNKAGPMTECYGDNTDWSSILTCLKRAISPRNHVQPSKTTGLVVGAGGMGRAAIYALIQLGCRSIFIYNRTIENAEAVARHFNESAGAESGGRRPVEICHVLTSISQPWPTEYQQPTMVISCVPAATSDGSPPADFEMPKQWLGSTTGGVVVEVRPYNTPQGIGDTDRGPQLAYEPLITPLVAQMQVFRDTVSPSWVVVDGLEVVEEMAIESFELMTGRMAPKKLMREVCRKTWEQQRRDLSSLP
jgi:shikimate 5-dehydrogenase/shikimate kinase